MKQELNLHKPQNQTAKQLQIQLLVSPDISLSKNKVIIQQNCLSSLQRYSNKYKLQDWF